MILLVALLAGAGLGAGLLLVGVGLWPAAPDPLSALARLDAARWAPVPPPPADRLTRLVGRRAAAALGAHGWPGSTLAADLRTLSLPVSTLAAVKAAWAVGGLLTPAALAGAARLAGIGVPLLVPFWVCLAAGTVGFFAPDTRVHRRAVVARRGLRATVAAYLDLVAMRVASGAGLAEALLDAAAVGRTDAFGRIRGALADARTDGLTPAGALGRLGQELALAELTDVAARLALVEGGGAQTEASLRAQAASLRDAQAADVHGRANEASQQMLVAQVVLAFGFLLFLGYPAVVRLLSF